MNDLFGPYKSKRNDFPELGKHYTPPEFFRHGRFELVARLERIDLEDGQDVFVWECRMPAIFYKIEAIPTEKRPGFTLITGSGMKKMAADIAKSISCGMLGMDNKD